MPKYIAITPTFNPYSFEDYAKLPILYTQAFKEKEQIYNENMDKIAQTKALLGPENEGNRSMHIALKEYEQSLNDIGNIINEGTCNSSLIEGTNNLRNYYREKILPINAAMSAYDKAKTIRIQKDDGTLIGSNINPDMYYNNMQYEDSFLLGSSIEKDAIEAIKTEATLRGPKSSYYKNPNAPGYIFQKETTGFTSEDKINFENQFKPNENGIYNVDNVTDVKIKEHIKNFRNKYNYDNLNDYEKNQVDHYIADGISSAMVGDTKINHFIDRSTINSDDGGKGKKEKPVLRHVGWYGNGTYKDGNQTDGLFKKGFKEKKYTDGSTGENFINNYKKVEQKRLARIDALENDSSFRTLVASVANNTAYQNYVNTLKKHYKAAINNDRSVAGRTRYRELLNTANDDLRKNLSKEYGNANINALIEYNELKYAKPGEAKMNLDYSSFHEGPLLSGDSFDPITQDLNSKIQRILYGNDDSKILVGTGITIAGIVSDKPYIEATVKEGDKDKNIKIPLSKFNNTDLSLISSHINTFRRALGNNGQERTIKLDEYETQGILREALDNLYLNIINSINTNKTHYITNSEIGVPRMVISE